MVGSWGLESPACGLRVRCQPPPRPGSSEHRSGPRGGPSPSGTRPWFSYWSSWTRVGFRQPWVARSRQVVSAFQVGVSSAKKRSYSVGERGLPGVEVERASWAGAGAGGRSSTAGRGTDHGWTHLRHLPGRADAAGGAGPCTRGPGRLAAEPAGEGERAGGGWRWEGLEAAGPGEGGSETVQGGLRGRTRAHPSGVREGRRRRAASWPRTVARVPRTERPLTGRARVAGGRGPRVRGSRRHKGRGGPRGGRGAGKRTLGPARLEGGCGSPRVTLQLERTRRAGVITDSLPWMAELPCCSLRVTAISSQGDPIKWILSLALFYNLPKRG